MGNSTRRLGLLAAIALLWSGGLGLGCAGGHPPGGYAYFASPAPNDAWSRKIRLWQTRARDDREITGVADVAEPGPKAPVVAAARGDLRAKYDAFRNERKREMARDLARWIQKQAGDHYFADGPIDHWATLAETFERNGDDCDGLELLVYHLLRDLGFSKDEVFRAIVFRRNDGQHHMVTLWFENADDPWVIDPTGAMTSGMPRMSEVPGWTPLKIFTEDRDYTVRPSEQDRFARN